jgi:hypothetical protein
MRRLGYDHDRMTRQPPAVRFQAEQSNALWHFDMSPSDLKQLPTLPWIDPDRSGAPTLMLFSVVDDRSGAAYQEYRCVYGEDAEAALRFLFAAMARKTDEADPFQGIPAVLYLDSGPVAKSAVFKRVMESLGVAVTPHMQSWCAGNDPLRLLRRRSDRPLWHHRGDGECSRLPVQQEGELHQRPIFGERRRLRRSGGGAPDIPAQWGDQSRGWRHALSETRLAFDGQLRRLPPCRCKFLLQHGFYLAIGGYVD